MLDVATGELTATVGEEIMGTLGPKELKVFAFRTAKAIQENWMSAGAALLSKIVKPCSLLLVTINFMSLVNTLAAKASSAPAVVVALAEIDVFTMGCSK